MQLNKMLIYGTLLLNSLIITDSFLLPTIKREEIYKLRSSVTSHDVGFRYYSHGLSTTDYLITESGHRYQLPDHCYIHRTENDSVTIGITRLLRRPASVGWCEESGCYTTNIRMFSSGFPLASVCITTLFVLALLFFPSLLSERREPYLYMALAFAVMFFVFYFW